MIETNRPRISIEYCARCRFVLRAAWLAQEVLFTFGEDLGEVALIPGEGGVFVVAVNGKTVFSKADRGRFPEAKELKQLLRDHIAPDRHLGHSDRE